MKKYAFGIDVGGTTVKCGLFLTTGDMVESWEIPTRTEDNGKNILPDIAKAVKGKMKSRHIDPYDVEGVGIGVPGPVLENGIVNVAVNLHWGVFNIEDTLSGLLDGIHVEAGNDANVAALGEAWKGGGRGFRNVVMVTLGTGVGGAIIVNGRIIPGAHGSAGEIGHMQMVDDEEDQCNCGKHGCLEQYASANGITRVAHRYLKKYKKVTVLKDDESLSSKMIFDAAKAGDACALDLVEYMCSMLGKALAHVAAVVDPECFVIGGGVCKAGPIVTDNIEKYYREYVFHGSREAVFKLAELGNEAGMYGAVKMLL